jgi:hypothetical protein
MSTAFTAPGNATWQTLLNELTLAYSERRQAVSERIQSVNDAYIATDDKDIQAFWYWSTIQGWIENNCLVFIDITGPLTPDKTAFLFYTLASFRSVAGLHEDGFRRVPEGVEWNGTDDPVWSYGQMQEGDIIGPWIFEDLQKAFSVMLWAVSLSRCDLLDGLVKAAGGTCVGSADEAYALAVTDWNNSEWDHWLAGLYRNGAEAFCYTYLPTSDPRVDTFYVDIYRVRFKYHIETPVSLTCARVYEAYTKATNRGSVAHYGTADRVFYNNGEYFSGETLVEGEYVLLYASSETTESIIETDYLTSEAIPEKGAVPSPGHTAIKGFAEGAPQCLIKWNFTNA